MRSTVSSLGRLMIRSTRPLLRAISTLGPSLDEIDAEWERRLSRLARSSEEFEVLSEMNPRKALEEFRSKKFRGFREIMTGQGEMLANLEIPLEHAITASRDYLNLSLKYLPRGDASTRTMALSLVRLSSVGQLFLISGYTHQRTARLRMLGKSLAAAEEHLQSLSRIITDVYDQERRSISRDLHDEVGHDLIVLKLYLELIHQHMTEKRFAGLPGKLDEAIALVTKAIERVRQLSFDLGPAISNELGFSSALKLYIRQFAKRTGIRINLRTRTMAPPLPSTHEMTLYRVLQGALSNVAQHAKARNVTIRLWRNRHSVHMTVEDDGVGFHVRRVMGPDRAFGLMTMRERVELLGGDFLIQSSRSGKRDRRGTRIEVTLPVYMVQSAQ